MSCCGTCMDKFQELENKIKEKDFVIQKKNRDILNLLKQIEEMQTAFRKVVGGEI